MGGGSCCFRQGVHTAHQVLPHLACKLLQGLWLVGPSCSFTVCFVYYLFRPGELALVVPHPVCRHRCGVLAGVVGSPRRQAGDAAEDRWHSLCRLHHWVRLCAAVARRIECHCCFSGVLTVVVSSPLPTIATAMCWLPQIRRGHWGDPCGGTCNPHAIPSTSRTASPPLAQ